MTLRHRSTVLHLRRLGHSPYTKYRTSSFSRIDEPENFVQTWIWMEDLKRLYELNWHQSKARENGKPDFRMCAYGNIDCCGLWLSDFRHHVGARWFSPGHATRSDRVGLAWPKGFSWTMGIATMATVPDVRLWRTSVHSINLEVSIGDSLALSVV